MEIEHSCARSSSRTAFDLSSEPENFIVSSAASSWTQYGPRSGQEFSAFASLISSAPRRASATVHWSMHVQDSMSIPPTEPSRQASGKGSVELVRRLSTIHSGTVLPSQTTTGLRKKPSRILIEVHEAREPLLTLSPPPQIRAQSVQLYGMRSPAAELQLRAQGAELYKVRSPAAQKQTTPMPLSMEEKFRLQMHHMNAFGVRLARRQGIAARIMAKAEEQDHGCMKSSRLRHLGEQLRSPRRLLKVCPPGKNYSSDYVTTDLLMLKIAPEFARWVAEPRQEPPSLSSAETCSDGDGLKVEPNRPEHTLKRHRSAGDEVLRSDGGKLLHTRPRRRLQPRKLLNMIHARYGGSGANTLFRGLQESRASLPVSRLCTKPELKHTGSGVYQASYCCLQNVHQVPGSARLMAQEQRHASTPRPDALTLSPRGQRPRGLRRDFPPKQWNIGTGEKKDQGDNQLHGSPSAPSTVVADNMARHNPLRHTVEVGVTSARRRAGGGLRRSAVNLVPIGTSIAAATGASATLSENVSCSQELSLNGGILGSSVTETLVMIQRVPTGPQLIAAAQMRKKTFSATNDLEARMDRGGKQVVSQLAPVEATATRILPTKRPVLGREWFESETAPKSTAVGSYSSPADKTFGGCHQRVQESPQAPLPCTTELRRPGNLPVTIDQLYHRTTQSKQSPRHQSQLMGSSDQKQNIDPLCRGTSISLSILHLNSPPKSGLEFASDRLLRATRGRRVPPQASTALKEVDLKVEAPRREISFCRHPSSSSSVKRHRSQHSSCTSETSTAGHRSGSRSPLNYADSGEEPLLTSSQNGDKAPNPRDVIAGAPVDTVRCGGISRSPRVCVRGSHFKESDVIPNRRGHRPCHLDPSNSRSQSISGSRSRKPTFSAVSSHPTTVPFEPPLKLPLPVSPILASPNKWHTSRQSYESEQQRQRIINALSSKAAAAVAAQELLVIKEVDRHEANAAPGVIPTGVERTQVVTAAESSYLAPVPSSRPTPSPFTAMQRGPHLPLRMATRPRFFMDKGPAPPLLNYTPLAAVSSPTVPKPPSLARLPITRIPDTSPRYKQQISSVSISPFVNDHNQPSSGFPKPKGVPTPSSVGQRAPNNMTVPVVVAAVPAVVGEHKSLKLPGLKRIFPPEACVTPVPIAGVKGLARPAATMAASNLDFTLATAHRASTMSVMRATTASLRMNEGAARDKTEEQERERRGKRQQMKSVVTVAGGDSAATAARKQKTTLTAAAARGGG